MAHLGAACFVSAGAGMRNGSATSMTMMPVVHSVKLTLHHLFIHTAKSPFGWHLIPE